MFSTGSQDVILGLEASELQLLKRLVNTFYIYSFDAFPEAICEQS